MSDSGVETQRHPKVPDDLSYEVAKQLARDPDPDVRRALAAREDLRPEVLYFLAEDRDPTVRLEVARNKGAPRKADLLLTRDADEDIRTGLAIKISRLVPEMPEDSKNALYALTVQALETLAEDQMAMVRRVLAESLKDVANAPHGVIRLLAEDSELSVAQPVLEFSPVLSDRDLIEIMNSQPIQGAMKAIARRASLGSDVADAFVEMGTEEEIAALLTNESAQIREETLDLLVERAENRPLWHEPLVLRPRISTRSVLRLANFVAMNLLDRLQNRLDLPPDTLAAVASTVERRLEQEATGSQRKPDQQQDHGDIDQRISRLAKIGQLNSDEIEKALSRGERAFVIKALVFLSNLPERSVKDAIDAQNAKSIVAIVWKADLNPRLAPVIQSQMAGIPPREMIRVVGEDWPISLDDMEWQLSHLGADEP